MTNHRKPDGAPPALQEAFLAQLRETGNVSAAVMRGDLDAAAEALDSRWATQTGRRATDIAAMLRSGEA